MVQAQAALAVLDDVTGARGQSVNLFPTEQRHDGTHWWAPHTEV
jgi:hypothetical protein